MNQKLALSLFFGGLATFLSSLGELLSMHKSWTELSAPNEIGHITLITASFCMVIAGALGVQLPREGRKTDRVSDQKLSDINMNGSER